MTTLEGEGGGGGVEEVTRLTFTIKITIIHKVAGNKGTSITKFVVQFSSSDSSHLKQQSG